MPGEVRKTAELALRYDCICAFSLQIYTEFPGSLVKGGFTLGTDTTSLKVACAKELVNIGREDIDMTIPVGALKGGSCECVVNDIKAIRDVVEDRYLKVYK